VEKSHGKQRHCSREDARMALKFPIGKIIVIWQVEISEGLGYTN